MAAAAFTLKRTAQKMPSVGFGLWKVPRPQCADLVYNALKAGYRLLDGAGDYGNEKEAGEGLKRAIDDGIVKREDVFITSKLWNTYHEKHVVKDIAKHQLGLWGIEQFDLYLVHFPVSLEFIKIEDKYPTEWWGLDGKVHPINVPFQETWQAMEDLVDEGIAKNIGVSNCQGSLIVDLLRYARIEPAVLQVEIHPFLTQEALIALCKHHDIAITAYSSFGPASWIELDMHKHVESLLDHSLIKGIADALGRSPAQVLLRWALQQGLAVVPKSNNPDRLLSNRDLFSFEIAEKDMKEISSLNVNYRLNDPVGIHPALGIFA